jgi:hypothetical protein
MRRAAPELYVAVVRALARLRAPEIVPALAAFAVTGRDGCGVELPAFPIAGAGAAAPLLRAYDWFWQQRDWFFAYTGARGVPRRIHEPPCGSQRSPLQDSTFAADALREMGEVDLLRAVRRLSLGDASLLLADPDPRAFEALLLTLCQHPRAAEDRGACLAAVAGLEALGDFRCLTLLEASGRRWAAGYQRESTLAYRAAATRLRERLAAGRGELTPSESPAGSGYEIAPGVLSER